MSDNTNKVRYALNLLSSLEEMREENIICDFIIKAGGETFPVHRSVLAASSQYFRALLQSGMLEAQQGFVNMESMDATTAKIIVTYMYTGDAEITNGSVTNVLGAAHLLQLDDLVVYCWRFLQNNISADKCVSIIQLSRLYDRPDVENLAEKYLVEHLGQVSSTKSFSSIRKDDFVRYVDMSNENPEVLWQAMVSWVSPLRNNRDQVMIELMKVVKIEGFPFLFLFEKISTESLVKSSTPVSNYILEEMFFMEEVESEISHEIVLTLKEIVEESNITQKKEAMKIINDCMLKKFEYLIEKEEFVHLNEDDMLMILQSSETRCSSEGLKWKAILNWTKHDRGRKKSFTKFFKLLKLERLSNDFIRDVISHESMVKSSTECLQLIVEASLGKKKDEVDRAAARVATNPRIANLYWRDPETEVIRLFDVKSNSFCVLCRLDDIKGINGFNCAIVNCNGVIYVLVKENLFQLDRNNKWIELVSLPRKAGYWPKMTSLEGDIYVLANDSSTMACYPPSRNEWTVDLPSCGVDRGFCTVSFGKSFYALGGVKDENVTNEVKRYDPNRRNWSNMEEMLEKRSRASAAILHGSIVVAGGSDGNKNLNSVECYTHLTRSWSKLTNMNFCRLGYTLLTICDKLYACGGDIDGIARRFKNEGTIEVYNEEDGKWDTLTKDSLFSSVFRACEYTPE